jgi:hypothetical protein
MLNARTGGLGCAVEGHGGPFPPTSIAAVFRVPDIVLDFLRKSGRPSRARIF